MKALTFIFVKVPRKIICIIFYKWEYLYYRFFYIKPKININFIRKRYLIAGGDDFDTIVLTYRKLFSDKVKTKIDEADLICEHIFGLLGSRPKRLSLKGKNYQPVDWHSDFKSGYRWNPKTFYRNIRYGHIEGVDVKIPWELSRFQHLNMLGQAYVLTKNKKYAEEFANQISDWINNNPIGLGVNWSCTMDAAIRAANWLVAQEYFSEEGLIPDDFWRKFYTSIYEHGKFIREHLENHSGFTSNHYLSNLVGLFFIAIYCPFFKKSKNWQEFALKELTNEIEKQVYPDGCNFEASTSYHRLALELFFYAEFFGKRSGIEFPESYKKQVRKMFEFSLYCIKPDGRIPQVGDNDSGRFLIFYKRPILEHKYLLTLALIYYKDSDYKISIFDFDEEAFWIFGEAGKRTYDDLQFRNKPISSKAFPEAGWYIIRNSDNYCFISCGPNGQNEIGGHAHNDKLSFELMLDGQDIFLDPGTYVYTSYPQERNRFRSTGCHNTIKFTSDEQNEIPEKDMFSLPEKVKIINADLKEVDNNIIFQGEIQYSGITHKRIITLDKESINMHIKDIFSSLKPLNGKLLFHLSPDLISDGNGILIKEAKEKIATIKVFRHSIEKEEYSYSLEYGIKTKADCLVVNFSKPADVHEINTYIRKIQ